MVRLNIISGLWSAGLWRGAPPHFTVWKPGLGGLCPPSPPGSYGPELYIVISNISCILIVSTTIPGNESLIRRCGFRLPKIFAPFQLSPLPQNPVYAPAHKHTTVYLACACAPRHNYAGMHACDNCTLFPRNPSRIISIILMWYIYHINRSGAVVIGEDNVDGRSAEL